MNFLMNYMGLNGLHHLICALAFIRSELLKEMSTRQHFRHIVDTCYHTILLII